MSHEINDNLCVYSLNHGGVPWHRIGTALERVTADDVLNVAGFNRRVSMQPLLLNVGLVPQVPGYRATYDESNGRVLGVVSEKYTVLQPVELLAAAEWLRSETGAEISFAAQLRSGSREVISLKLPDSEHEVADGDRVRSYFNLGNGHDGKLSVCVGASDIRVVCANTLAAWLGERGAVTVTHRAGVREALAKAVAAFTLNSAQRAEFYTRMSEREMLPEEVIAYYDHVVGKGGPSMRSLRGRLNAMSLIGVPTSGDLPTTLWGAFNGVTQLATHELRTNRPLDSLYFGGGAKLLAKATTAAAELLGVA
jgi:phage/plasmid-like protein (TIGR03299 family)